MTRPTPWPVPGPRPAVPSDHGRDVADAMSGLDVLDDRPLAEHVEVFERIHRALGAALAGSAGAA